MNEKIQRLVEKLRHDNRSYLEGDTKPIGRVPTLWLYSSLFPEKGLPTNVNIDLNLGVPMSFIEHAKELGFVELTQSINYEPNSTKISVAVMSFVHENGYLLHINTDTKNSKSSDARLNRFVKSLGKDFEVAIRDYKPKKKNSLAIRFISDIELFAPSIQFINQEEFKKLLTDIGDWVIKYDPKENPEDSALIHMMVKEEYETYFKDFDVSNFAPKLLNPEVFYGQGFGDFNKKLINRLDNEKKGVVLFHGEPGTGKTHYIRYLLRELTKIDKRVIYVPPSMVESMAEPAMMSFLVNNILEEARDTILLIEDAEPLLESREIGGGRTTGISNLLNSTDGLLNDILGLVIIATFNTHLSKIDQALLRPGRLMARKEFGKHSYERSLEIAKELKLSEQFKEKSDPKQTYTIAEICNFSKEREILLHEVKEERRKIGFS
jgi:hypothetical protein